MMTAYYSTYYPIIRHIQFCNSSLMITQHPCSCTYKGGMKDGSLNFLNIIIITFFCPLGILLHYFPVRALYPDTRTRPYEIRIYLHHSVLIALTASPFRPTRPPTVVGKVCLVTYPHWIKSVRLKSALAGT